MANFFSADYWKAFYFKAMGGQETAVDPNAMSGSFAGSSSWTGTLDQPEGAISGAFAGTSSFSGSLVSETSASLTGKWIRGRWKRREKPEPHPDDEFVRSGGRPAVSIVASVHVLEPPPKKITSGFLSRLVAAPEVQQISALRRLAEEAASKQNRKNIDRLNLALAALQVEVIDRAKKKRELQTEALQLAQELAEREAAIWREIEEEDEMLILMAA